MKCHAFVKFAIIIGVGLAGIANLAKASNDLRFHPAKPWDVKEVSPVDDFSGECAIQSEFNNGFILQLNGSSNWVQLLNLNIRQDAFEVDSEYPVKLEVPGAARRIIDGKAYKANVISVPLKGHKPLYKAMRDAGVLQIEIEGNVFHFDLKDFAEKARSFEYCMAGGGSDAGTQALAVSTKAMSEDEKDFLVNEAIAFESDETGETLHDIDIDVIEVEDVSLLTPEPAVESIIEPVVDPVDVKTVRIETPDAIINKTTQTQSADFTSEQTDFRYDASDTAALARITALEQKLALAQKQNASLNQELEMSLREGEQERLAISSENWDLERATKQYNEAERQIKRIGQELQKERARCAMEKQELEAMLFDPDLTSQEQLARLSTLEQQLSQAKATIANLKTQMGI